MATTEPVVYGYVGMPIEPSGTPRRGRVRARDIEGAWKHVEARLPDWRPTQYKVFVYSLLANPNEYQAADVVITNDGERTEVLTVKREPPWAP